MYESQNDKVTRLADELAHELNRQYIRKVAACRMVEADNLAGMALQVADLKDRLTAADLAEIAQDVSNKLGVRVLIEKKE